MNHRSSIALAGLLALVALSCRARRPAPPRGTDDEPPPIATLPAGRTVVVAVEHSAARALVLDGEGRGPWRWSALDSLFANRQQSALHAWWRPARGLLYVRVGTVDPVVFAVRRDGHAERVLAQSTDALRADRVDACDLAADASALVCPVFEPIEGHVPAAYHVAVHSYPLAPGAAPTVVRWADPVLESGVLVPSPDGRAVYFSERCPDAAFGSHCVERARPDGTQRTFFAMVGGNVCSIDASPDGRSLAIVSRTESYETACSELYVVPAEPPGAAAVHTSLRAPDPRTFTYDGVTSVAWSPDGARLAVLSDHAEGCAGAEGVSVCSAREYVVAASTAGFRPISAYAHESASLAWLPP